MAKRALAWIRHGKYAQPPGVPSAHLPHGLTPRGREQARAAAHSIWRYLTDQRLELDPRIDCSPLRRAWETADVLVQELEHLGSPKLAVSEVAALMERGLGAGANLSLAQIEAVVADDPRYTAPPPGWKRDARYVLPLPGAESLAQAGQRLANHVQARMRASSEAAPQGASPEERPAADAARATLTLFVGHGGAFRHAASVLGLLSPADVERLTMPHGAPLFFEYRSRRDGEAAPERWVRVAGEWRERSAAAPVD